MKFLVVFSTFLVFSLAELDPKLPEYMLECSTENGVDVAEMTTEESIEKMKDDPKFKCFLKCFTIKSGFCSDTGDFIEATVKAKASAEIVNDDDMKKIKECVNQQKQENLCDKISEIYKCIYSVINVKS